MEPGPVLLGRARGTDQGHSDLRPKHCPNRQLLPSIGAERKDYCGSTKAVVVLWLPVLYWDKYLHVTGMFVGR